MVMFWIALIPWGLLMTLWMLFALTSLFLVGVLSVLRWAIVWVEHGLTVLTAAALGVVMWLRPVPPKGTPGDPTATAPVTEALL